MLKKFNANGESHALFFLGSDKAQSILGWKPRSNEEAILAFAKALIEHKVVKVWCQSPAQTLNFSTLSRLTITSSSAAGVRLSSSLLLKYE